MVIAGQGSSLIAARYGAYIFKQLGIFDTIRVCDPADLRKVDFKDIKYGGFLAVSQSGEGKDLMAALKLAYEHNFTCMNIVNVEDSPITKVVDNINKESKKVQEDSKPAVLFDASDETDEEDDINKGNQNIGIYMKSAFCYSTIKSFIPSVICLSLVALWFSDNNQS